MALAAAVPQARRPAVRSQQCEVYDMAIFKNLPTSVPKSSGEVERVDLTQADMGARKSHIPTLEKNPKNAVRHVTQGRN